MEQDDFPKTSTPAHKDKRFWSTALVALVVVFNHKLGLELTSNELLILAAITGVFIGQSQLGELTKLKAVLGAPTTPDVDPAPVEQAGDPPR